MLRYVQNMKQPQFLLQGCSKYYLHEPRDAVYTVSNTYVSASKTIRELSTGIVALLLSWNSRFYNVSDPNWRLRPLLAASIESILTKLDSDLKSLKGHDLASIDMQSLGSKVTRIYQAFAAHKSVGWIGAAKAIHLLKPDLFVPWDNGISSAFHRIHGSYGQRGSTMCADNASCYFEFMKNCQDIASELLQKSSKEKLSREHPAFKEMGQTREIPKMIDECNIVYITGKSTWS